MKTIVFALLAAVAFTTTVSAQTYSKSNPPHDLWCRDVRDGSIGGNQVCSAYTYEQCMASRYSPGERCYLNPRYDPRFQRK